tara:strand:- start:4131 stop:4631 length:501 start_codon:yes stop_codon:yes gene_type:complete
MKKSTFLFFSLLVSILYSEYIYSKPNLIIQQYTISDNGASYLADYIIKQYKEGKFDGIKFIDMNNESYMISAGTVKISDYKSTSSMRRVAEIRAKRNIINFENEGSEVTGEMIDLVDVKGNNNSVDLKEFFSDIVSEKASGFVAGMQTLTTFKFEEDLIYVIYKKI